MSGIGRRLGRGRYEVTFDLDADDLEDIASAFPHPDAFGPELLALADEIRAKEAAREEGPWLRVVVSRGEAA